MFANALKQRREPYMNPTAPCVDTAHMHFAERDYVGSLLFRSLDRRKFNRFLRKPAYNFRGDYKDLADRSRNMCSYGNTLHIFNLV